MKLRNLVSAAFLLSLTVFCAGDVFAKSGKKSVLMVLTSKKSFAGNYSTGVWLEEFAAPYTAFKARNFNVVVVSIAGGAVSIDPKSKPDEAKAALWKNAIAELEKTKSVESVSASDFDAVFLPGGHGTMFDFPRNKTLRKLVSDFAESGKIIAAICHGPAAFVDVKLANGKYLVAGKKITSFTDSEEISIKMESLMPFMLEKTLREQGAVFVAGKPWSSHIEADGNLLTGQNPMSTEALADAVISKLGER